MISGKGPGVNSRRNKVIEVGVVSIFLAVLIVMAWADIRQLDQAAKERSADTLRTVLHSTYNSINLWTSDRLRNAEGMAAEVAVLNNARALLALPRSQDTLIASPEMSNLREILAPEIKAMAT